MTIQTKTEQMDISLEITAKQSKALDLLSVIDCNTVIYGGAAGGGKSFLGCLWIILNAIKYPETRWLIGRNQLTTLKETTMITLFEVFKLLGLQIDKHWTKHSDKHIDLWNGSRILFKDLAWAPTDPHYDQLGSLEVTGIFVDEITQITEKCFEILKSRIRYKLDQFNLSPKFLGTCNPNKNWVYTRFYLPWKRNNLDKDIYFIPALPGDNPHLSIHYINELRKLNPTDRARLLNGEWEYQADGDQLMDNSWFNNWGKEDKGEWYITADIARYGEDSSVIILWRGNEIYEIYQYQKESIIDIAKEIQKVSIKYNIKGKNIIIDESGIGGGTIDYLKSINLNVIGFIGGSKPKRNENYINLRQECFFELPLHKLSISDSLKKKQWNIGNKQESLWNVILQELSSIKRLPIDGKPKINSKDNIKASIGRSPDLADCISMKMFWELKPRYGVRT